MYQTPCLCSVGFLNRSDKSSDTAFRYQGQRIVHLYAALQVCIAQRFHCCQGDRIPLDFALVHQRVRDRTNEAHVGSRGSNPGVFNRGQSQISRPKGKPSQFPAPEPDKATTQPRHDEIAKHHWSGPPKTANDNTSHLADCTLCQHRLRPLGWLLSCQTAQPLGPWPSRHDSDETCGRAAPRVSVRTNAAPWPGYHTQCHRRRQQRRQSSDTSSTLVSSTKVSNIKKTQWEHQTRAHLDTD